MSTPVMAMHSEYLDPKAFRFARNQREAGIEHLQWEERIKPLRPLSHDIAAGICVVAVAAACLLV
jgi:hypothetical protein